MSPQCPLTPHPLFLFSAYPPTRLSALGFPHPLQKGNRHGAWWRFSGLKRQDFHVSTCPHNNHRINQFYDNRRSPRLAPILAQSLTSSIPTGTNKPRLSSTKPSTINMASVHPLSSNALFSVKGWVAVGRFRRRKGKEGVKTRAVVLAARVLT